MLGIDPSGITETARFKEDLEADSLDLYTLVQELEDSYGVKMSDDEAAKILTVAQAVDFVLAHAPAAPAVRRALAAERPGLAAQLQLDLAQAEFSESLHPPTPGPIRPDSHSWA